MPYNLNASNLPHSEAALQNTKTLLLLIIIASASGLLVGCDVNWTQATLPVYHDQTVVLFQSLLGAHDDTSDAALST